VFQFIINTFDADIMHKIEYEIDLNQNGRPCINLPIDYEQKPEDRFFTIEITRYMLNDLLTRRSKDLDSNTITVLDESERFLGQISDEIAKLLYESMKTQGELYMMIDNQYHIYVNSIEERDGLPENNILYNEMLLDRFDGLRVAVGYINNHNNAAYSVYELKGGITNEYWVLLYE